MHDAHLEQAVSPGLVQGQLSVPQHESQLAVAAATSRTDIVSDVRVLWCFIAQKHGRLSARKVSTHPWFRVPFQGSVSVRNSSAYSVRLSQDPASASWKRSTGRSQKQGGWE